MHILITGINGQIGTRLSNHLTSLDITHRGVDISECPLKIPFMRCDLSDMSCLNDLQEFLKPVTHVIHLAGKISAEKDFILDLQEQFVTSVVVTINLLKALPETVKHISYASSMVVYGQPSNIEVDETTETSPEKSYAYGKIATEKVLKQYGTTNKVPVTLMRLASVYGPGRITSRAIPNMIEKVLNNEDITIYGSGLTSRDYIYIDDVCEMILQASTQKLDGVYNFSSGKATTLISLAETICEIISEQNEIKSDIILKREMADGYSIFLNCKKLGYTSYTSLLSGLKSTIRWHKDLKSENIY